MNYRQIRELIKKPGTWFEVTEDYYYDTEFETQTIPKGTKIQYLHPALQSWIFKFEEPMRGFLGNKIGFGRSRLLKIRLKEITVSPKGREK